MQTKGWRGDVSQGYGAYARAVSWRKECESRGQGQASKATQKQAARKEERAWLECVRVQRGRPAQGHVGEGGAWQATARLHTLSCQGALSGRRKDRS